jgi:catechol 2,3-dioxygenase-like lactoylglutathione lyase family enzyme
MNTEITIHPNLQHCGLTTGNLDAMLDWYRKVLGIVVHARVNAPAGSPFKTVAFATNDEVNHRLSFFETPGLSSDGDRDRHARVQHMAFEYKSLEDLLGTYLRLKNHPREWTERSEACGFSVQDEGGAGSCPMRERELQVLGRMFRGKFLALLGAAYRKKNLRFPGLLEPLSSPTAFDRFIRQLRRLEWVVYAKPPLGADHVIRYLARYTHRVAISNGRLISLTDGHVTFRWRDSADGNKQKLMTIDSAEFVRRFLLHVLPRGFVKIRHFGFLSNRTRSISLPLCRLLLQTPEAAPAGASQPSLPDRKCPVCRIGVLRTVALIPATELAALLVHAPFNSA